MTRGDFQSYLRAKRTVDDRALRRDQVDRLREWLSTRAAADGGPLRILEVGAGIGTMIERLLEWDVLPGADVRYTAVDLESANVRTLRSALPAWATDRGYSVETGDRLTISDGDRRLVVRPVAADASTVVAEATAEWDLLVGAAVLDVIGLDALPTLLSALAPGGRWYFPITFDGGTRFTPTHPADRAVERYYHAHMDAKPGGDSRAGTHALDRLKKRADATVLAVGGSDWVVRPVDGEYPAEEAAFLDHILGTVETAVGEIDRGEDLPDETLADWVTARAADLGNRRLTYTTHQLDLLGRVEG